MQKNNPKRIIGSVVLIIIGFILGGTGLTILYNSKGDMTSVVGGFALIGVAMAVFYVLIKNE